MTVKYRMVMLPKPHTASACKRPSALAWLPETRAASQPPQRKPTNAVTNDQTPENTVTPVVTTPPGPVAPAPIASPPKASSAMTPRPKKSPANIADHQIL